MNEPHFFIYWLYNLKMHNLEMTKMDRTEPNPLCEYRWSNIQITVVDYDKLTNHISNDIENLTEVLSTVTITQLPTLQSTWTQSMQVVKAEKLESAQKCVGKFFVVKFLVQPEL